MARKKGGILSKLTGTPYDKLERQLDKMVGTTTDLDELATDLVKLAKLIRSQLREEIITPDEHDLLIEMIEDADPEQREFERVGDNEDVYYSSAGDVPDLDLELGDEVDLDDLMKSKKDSFRGTFARDEYDEAKARLAEEFYRESDEAVSSGSVRRIRGGDHRTFGDAEDEAEVTRRKIAEDMGLVEKEPDAPEQPHSEGADDDRYSVDEDGTEWWEDDDGQWWYRLPDGPDEWHPYDG